MVYHSQLNFNFLKLLFYLILIIVLPYLSTSTMITSNHFIIYIYYHYFISLNLTLANRTFFKLKNTYLIIILIVFIIELSCAHVLSLIKYFTFKNLRHYLVSFLYQYLQIYVIIITLLFQSQTLNQVTQLLYISLEIWLISSF